MACSRDPYHGAILRPKWGTGGVAEPQSASQWGGGLIVPKP